MQTNKKGNAAGLIVVIAAIVILGGAAIGGGTWAVNKFMGENQTMGIGGDDDKTTSGCQWAGQLVDGKFQSKSMFTGTSVDPSFKLWSAKPDGWGNPRDTFTFDNDNPYESYSSSSGEVTLSEDPSESPFYVMATLSGYQTKFIEVTNDGIIPCETNDDSLADYNSNPRTEKLRFVQESSVTVENVSLGISENGTDKEFTKYAYLSTEDDKGVALWKVTFKADNKSDLLEDSDNDNTYDMGVKEIRIKVGDKAEETIFNPSKGIEKIDVSTGKYEYTIKESDYSESDYYMDGESIPVKVFVKANTRYDSNSTATEVAGDEMLGNGETIGTLSLMSSEATDLGDVSILGE
jgi:hypothetical protein